MSAAAALLLCLSPTVHDGDTLWCGRHKIRIENIDAPELPDSPKCRDRRAATAWCDFQLGFEARDVLIELLASGTVYYLPMGEDPYRRMLARIYVGKIDAGNYLVARNLARRWR